MVRTKFKVESVKNFEHGYSHITLKPVVTGSKENDAFYKTTPDGELTLYCCNPLAIEKFSPGKDFYVDFTEVE